MEPSSLDFLGEALRDPEERVWQQALDGIVASGGPAANQVLKAVIARVERDLPANEEFLEWLDEARDHVLNGLFPGLEDIPDE